MSRQPAFEHFHSLLVAAQLKIGLRLKVEIDVGIWIQSNRALEIMERLLGPTGIVKGETEEGVPEREAWVE